MSDHRDRTGQVLKLGTLVRLHEVSPSLLRDLPAEDQSAIRDQVGKSVLLVDFDQSGLAEVEFTASDGVIHTIWVEPLAVEVT